MDLRKQITNELNINSQPDFKPAEKLATEIMADDAKKLAAGKLRAIRIDDMVRLSGLSQFMRPGTLTILGGDPGSGKTFMGLECLIASLKSYGSGYYIPLEGRHVDIMERVGLRLQRSWVGNIQLDGNETSYDLQRKAQCRTDMITRNKDKIDALQAYVGCPPGMDNNEATEWQNVAESANIYMRKNRVVIIDNLSFVHFNSQSIFTEQGLFVNQLIRGVQDTGATCLLLSHTKKRGRSERTGAFTQDDLAGSAAMARAADCVLLLESHQKKESEIYRKNGEYEIIEHNKTMHMGKTRHGSGEGQSLAYNFGLNGPTFEEFGVIKG